ncbi:unnamed protein product [Vicia faba]|uniref:Uncharacterized protein n=1 Tax=Vicia faba TaxID=3906 RepID=A0AAV0ZE60_VICFA|nr:unnamed protein product [Vicia faba]
MAISSDLSSPYFYVYLPFIKDIRICLLSSSLEAKVMRVLNIAPSQLAPNRDQKACQKSKIQTHQEPKPINMKEMQGKSSYSYSEKVGIKKYPSGKAMSLKSSLWSDFCFDIVKFINSHLFFSEEFPCDCKSLNTKPSPKLSDMKDNHLLRGLMLKPFDMEKRYHVKNELKQSSSVMKRVMLRYMDYLSLCKGRRSPGKLSWPRIWRAGCRSLRMTWWKTMTPSLGVRRNMHPFLPFISLSMLDIFKVIHNGHLVYEDTTSPLGHQGSHSPTCS